MTASRPAAVFVAYTERAEWWQTIRGSGQGLPGADARGGARRTRAGSDSGGRIAE